MLLTGKVFKQEILDAHRIPWQSLPIFLFVRVHLTLPLPVHSPLFPSLPLFNTSSYTEVPVSVLSQISAFWSVVLSKLVPSWCIAPDGLSFAGSSWKGQLWRQRALGVPGMQNGRWFFVYMEITDWYAVFFLLKSSALSVLALIFRFSLAFARQFSTMRSE